MLPDKFEFQRELGNGFFGRVVLARDVALDRLRAVKLIDPADVLNQDQLFAEAQVLADLNSPYIVPVYGAGQTEDGEIYIVMEYIESGSIADVMNDGVVPLRTAVSALIDVCRALEAVALKGIVHKDIKPTNILLTGEGPSEACRLWLRRADR